MNDLISRQQAIGEAERWLYDGDDKRTIGEMIRDLPSAQPTQTNTYNALKPLDCISRQAAIDAIDAVFPVDPMKSEYAQGIACGAALAKTYVEQLPSVQPEPLTDKEQRIFLAAMGREEKVCEEVDRNYVREPYEDSLMRVCKEIRRKVKGALWT